MIDFRQEPLETDRERKLRHWMNQPELQSLVSIAESLQIIHETEALKKALESGKFGDKIDSANQDLKNAIRYKEFLAVLNEIRSNKEPFQLTKPTTK